MNPNQLPRRVADSMVEHLFANRNPTSFDRLLYPGCGDGALVDAVHRYCSEDTFRDTPEEVAIDIDIPSELLERFPGVDMQEADFLGDTLDLGLGFDYLICDPPTVTWEALSREEQRAYASNSALITTDDSPDALRSDLLFIEQSLRHLADDGRAIFFTDRQYKTDDEAERFRQLLTEPLVDIIDVTPDTIPDLDEHHVITIIDNSLTDATEAPFRYNPSRYETMLGTRVDTERPFTAAALMTDDPRGYVAGDSAAETYIDMVHADYDAAPVYDGDGERGALLGYVSRERIRIDDGAQLVDRVTDLGSRTLVPEDAHISDIIERLGTERFQFVGDRTSVDGIITRLDLNRLPVYLHLFDCFSEFEIGLRELIRQEASDWAAEVDVHITFRSPKDLVADRLTAAQLSDLIEIVEEAELQRAILADIEGYERSLDDLRHLRNAVAHYNPIVHTMGDASTLNVDRRGAPQLAAEYAFLQDCIDGLASIDPVG